MVRSPAPSMGRMAKNKIQSIFSFLKNCPKSMNFYNDQSTYSELNGLVRGIISILFGLTKNGSFHVKDISFDEFFPWKICWWS